MGAASAGVQSPQSSMPAGKGAGASPSTPAGSTNSTTYPSTSGQPTMGAPNTNSNTGMDLAPAGKGGGSLAPAVMPSSPYAQPQDMSTFRNVDASGNPVTPMSGLGRYANTVGGQPISYLADKNQLPTGGPTSMVYLPDQSQNTIGFPNSNMAPADFQTGIATRTPNYPGATATTGNVMDGGRQGAIMRPSGKGGAPGRSQGKGPQ